MKNLIIFTSVVLFLLNKLNAQRNLQPGYIVNENNDTLSGFIDYKEWLKNPASISFATSKKTSLKQYDKSSLKYFEVTFKEAYKRYVVNKSLDANSFNTISGKDTSNTTDTVLLKIISLGKNVSLFFYKDQLKSRYYLLPNDEMNPFELKNSIYITDEKVISEKEYQKQLFAIAQKYPTINQTLVELINKSNYSGKYLIEICNQINGLLQNFRQAASKGRQFRFFAGVGLNKGLLAFSGDNKYSAGMFPFYYSPLVIAGIDILFNPYVGKLFLSNSISLAAYKCRAGFVKEYFQRKEYYNMTLKQTNISIQSQLSYNLYNRSSFKWYAGGGGGINFSSYPKNNQTFINSGSADTSITSTNNFLDTKKFWICPSVKTGVTIHNLGVILYYAPKTNIAQYLNYSVNNSTLQLQLIYLFNEDKKKDINK